MCSSQSERFNISQTTFVTIKGLHFVGCGGNRVSQVGQLIVKDTIFQGAEGRGTVLALNEVNAVSIMRSSFVSNKDSTFEYSNKSTFLSNQDIMNYVYLNRSSSLAVGGALYVVHSSILGHTKLIPCSTEHQGNGVGLVGRKENNVISSKYFLL